MITTLYQVEVPHTGRTTYNVGLISGGTSVNTIAQEAKMAYEFRSDERADLATMQQRFQTVIQEFRSQGVSVEVKPLGERPCSGDVDAARLDALVQLARAAIARESGTSPRILPGSTDCNIPLSLGIPSICFGCYLGGGAHTYQEWVEVASLQSGYRIALSAVLSRF
jgi:di/tripeptidase